MSIKEYKYNQVKALNRILQGRKVVHKDFTQTGSVASGTNETVTVTAPDGTIWFLRNLHIVIKSDPDATSGTHRVVVFTNPNHLGILDGESNYGTDLIWANGYWQSADSYNHPSNSAAPQNVVSSVLIDPTDGLSIRYWNDLDVAQENDRIYYLDVLEVTVS